MNARHYDPEVGRFVTADSVVDGEGSTQGWNRYMYVKGNPVRYGYPTGHEIVEPNKDNKETSWNIRKGDTLSGIVKKINKDYKMHVTVDDLLKSNIKNKAVKSKDKIIAGGKLNLSFLKIEKGYQISGIENERSVYTPIGGGGLTTGEALITEHKYITNVNSGRETYARRDTLVKYKAKSKGFGGSASGGPQFFTGLAQNFKDIEDAKKTFLESDSGGFSFIVKFSMTNKSRRSGETWKSIGVGLSFGWGETSKSSTERVPTTWKFESGDRVKKMVVKKGKREH